MNFETIQMLVTQALAGEDHRPAWLKDLPGAIEPREPYYKFMRLLAQRFRPWYSVEIGTRGGTAAFHLAHGNPDGHVLTIDIDPACAANVDKIATAKGITNLRAIEADSTQVVLSAILECPIDLLFIDGDHSYISSYQDYVNFRAHVVDGGLIVFDDTRLNDGMARAWERIADEKIELPELHYMGFGIAIKTPGRTVLPL